MKIKKGILYIFFLMFSLPLLAQYTVEGGSGRPFLATNDAANGIEVYFLNGLNGVKISFQTTEEGNHLWYKYSHNTAAVEIPCTQEGKTSYITDITDGYGYYVELSSNSIMARYVWIIDYSRYLPSFFSLVIDEDEDKCEYLKLKADVEAEPLTYYTVVGAMKTIQRNYHLYYNTLEWNENDLLFEDKPVEKSLQDVYEITLEAPLRNTDFTLTGDAFAEHFGLTKTIRTPVYEAIAVESHSTAVSTKEYGKNELKTSGNEFGGSAPIDITFTAYANEPIAYHYIWKLVELDPATGQYNAIARYTDKIFTYRFEKNGYYRAELEVDNAWSSCTDTTQFYPINIDETVVEVPNFFTPGSSIGSNDEFKVSYKSVVSFKCSIFNRWGNLLYQWTDPTKGWDGRVQGKFVTTGVYFYVIEYKGVDGKKKTLSGDINILRKKD
jgi:gliding motility-associated-like protein